MLINIQFLRFVAAMLVVFFHCAAHLQASRQAPGLLFGFGQSAGFAGVDIFFVISGFIMAWTTADDRAADAVAFAKRRVARIYSGYWPFFLLALGLFSLLGGQYMADKQLWAKVNEPGWADNDQHRAVMDKVLRAYAREQSE